MLENVKLTFNVNKDNVPIDTLLLYYNINNSKVTKDNLIAKVINNEELA